MYFLPTSLGVYDLGASGFRVSSVLSSGFKALV